jgi:hypothetical protein
MHDTTVVMKDGRRFCNPMMLFRPAEGYMTLMIDPGPDVKLYFRDMQSCITKDQRTRIDVIEDEDEIARAREQGWDGK